MRLRSAYRNIRRNATLCTVVPTLEGYPGSQCSPTQISAQFVCTHHPEKKAQRGTSRLQSGFHFSGGWIHHQHMRARTCWHRAARQRRFGWSIEPDSTIPPNNPLICVLTAGIQRDTMEAGCGNIPSYSLLVAYPVSGSDMQHSRGLGLRKSMWAARVKPASPSRIPLADFHLISPLKFCP